MSVSLDRASVQELATAFNWSMIIDASVLKDGQGGTVRRGSRRVRLDRASTVLGVSPKPTLLAASAFPYVHIMSRFPVLS